MTKAELEIIYGRVIGTLNEEFRQRGWLPPAQPLWSPSEDFLVWLDEQIDDARRQQLHGFRTSNIVGERAWARHCALYEVREKFSSTLSSPDWTTNVEGV